jgi:hypothetical protein
MLWECSANGLKDSGFDQSAEQLLPGNKDEGSWKQGKKLGNIPFVSDLFKGGKAPECRESFDSVALWLNAWSSPTLPRFPSSPSLC